MRDLLRDLAGLGGCGLVSAGAWLLHPAAGLIVAGSMLIYVAMITGGKR